MTPEEFSTSIGTLVRTGEITNVLVRVANRAAVAMHKGGRRKTSGVALFVRTGDLRGSIVFDTRKTRTGVSAIVSAGSKAVPYAAIHEYGGVVKTRHTSFIMPKRPYLAPSRASAAKGVPHDLIKEVRKSLRTVGIGG